MTIHEKLDYLMSNGISNGGVEVMTWGNPGYRVNKTVELAFEPSMFVIYGHTDVDILYCWSSYSGVICDDYVDDLVLNGATLSYLSLSGGTGTITIIYA